MIYVWSLQLQFRYDSLFKIVSCLRFIRYSFICVYSVSWVIHIAGSITKKNPAQTWTHPEALDVQCFTFRYSTIIWHYPSCVQMESPSPDIKLNTPNNRRSQMNELTPQKQLKLTYSHIMSYIYKACFVFICFNTFFKQTKKKKSTIQQLS